MNSNKRPCSVIATTFAILAALGAASPASAYSVYRGVVADPQHHVIWEAGNFGVSGGAPSLSFFHYANDAAARAAMNNFQCLVKIDLGNVAPAPGANFQVGNAGIAVGAFAIDQPLAFPWQIDFDNNPPDHWSIARAQISTGNNAAASRVAAAGAANLAFNDPDVTVINGNKTGCAR
ncbi:MULTISPECIES: hypothetical protein [unclassified Rhizobium]|uniref:hypothetical protein n=1 Tax=unclassified Rhizobium TaxID=2613769 RepID=UPI0007EC2B66|nr:MULTISPECIES: hypothetical protein [unclassified Rhizobium]ANK85798.1 hypothetical protein AMK02_CH02216 [Rhizobium sp. N731]ANL16045.1 hypothetical protein AMJ97_CH02215 [Rhizobium sp. N1314]